MKKYTRMPTVKQQMKERNAHQWKSAYLTYARSWFHVQKQKMEIEISSRLKFHYSGAKEMANFIKGWPCKYEYLSPQ